MGSKGRVAEIFGDLVKEVCSSSANKRGVEPKAFKDMIGCVN